MTTISFLDKLYYILEDEKFDDIISWQHDGLSFLIKKTQQLEDTVLPKFFKHNNIQSFIRQLNMYSFQKTRHDSNYREFKQTYFRRDRKDLLVHIKRKSQQNISQRILDTYLANGSSGGPTLTELDVPPPLPSPSTAADTTSTAIVTSSSSNSRNKKVCSISSSSNTLSRIKQLDNVIDDTNCDIKSTATAPSPRSHVANNYNRSSSSSFPYNTKPETDDIADTVPSPIMYYESQNRHHKNLITNLQLQVWGLNNKVVEMENRHTKLCNFLSDAFQLMDDRNEIPVTNSNSSSSSSSSSNSGNSSGSNTSRSNTASGYSSSNSSQSNENIFQSSSLLSLSVNSVPIKQECDTAADKSATTGSDTTVSAVDHKRKRSLSGDHSPVTSNDTDSEHASADSVAFNCNTHKIQSVRVAESAKIVPVVTKPSSLLKEKWAAFLNDAKSSKPDSSDTMAVVCGVSSTTSSSRSSNDSNNGTFNGDEDALGAAYSLVNMTVIK